MRAFLIDGPRAGEWHDSAGPVPFQAVVEEGELISNDPWSLTGTAHKVVTYYPNQMILLGRSIWLWSVTPIAGLVTQQSPEIQERLFNMLVSPEAKALVDESAALRR